MESAIPPHLRCPRTQPTRMPDNYTPPVEARVARFKPTLTRIAMAYCGVQYHEPGKADAARIKTRLSELCADGPAPAHVDYARHVDGAGFTNEVRILYWHNPDAFDTWLSQHGEVWLDSATGRNAGVFIEALRPNMQRVETLFSSQSIEGVGHLSEHLSTPVQEHAYWGGMRDRLPLSQTDALAPSGSLRVISEGSRQRVIANDNLCLIRSGQDWTSTQGDERALYLNDVEPVLRAGMNFLNTSGPGIGCYANRYFSVVNADSQPLDKSFGMSWWHSLEHLENWAESHPTHVAIFGAAMKYFGHMGAAAQLKLYHEVTVAAADEQYFDYRQCHPQTGLLNAVRF